MLPVVDKPLIQYGVEEAIQSGVETISIVTGRGKSAMEDRFAVSYELEQLLKSKNKTELHTIAQSITDMADISYIRQKEALGLGHTVLRAKELVGYEPFAVVLSDDIIAAQKPCIRQLTDVHDQYGASVLALMEMPKEQISAYGVVDAEPVPGNDRLFKIRNIVEKPKAADAPSNPAIIGRYVLRLNSSGASSRLDRAAAGRFN